MGTVTKSGIGKEDLTIQVNTDSAETFDRVGSMGGTQTLTKFPDIWDGTGRISVAQVDTDLIETLSTGLTTDPTDSSIVTPTVASDITETIAAGDLTHDVLKSKVNEILSTQAEVVTALTALETKINEILAELRTAGFFS